MTVLKGNGVFGGIAFGKLSFYKREDEEIKLKKIKDAEAEVKRYEAAKNQAINELEELYESASEKVGEEEAMIFKIHQMMLDDVDYCESIINIIKSENANAEYAVWVTARNFSSMFSDMDDSYMKERATDVMDVSKRLIKIICESDENVHSYSEPCIVGADDLTPSETVQFNEDTVKAFVTAYGSTNSHTAILARTMNIPAVVGIGNGLKKEFDGCEIIVDGYSGTVYVLPDVTTIERLKKKQELCEYENKQLQSLKGIESVTKDGQKVNLYANIGSLSDLKMVLQNGAEGIGLFRSEFLYLKRHSYPTEDEQFDAYKKVIEKMEGKRVIIRTLDIGADKKVKYFNLPQEENPAMGYRAIRICLDRTEVFKTQLRAIYRASKYGKVSIMFPMIISVDEVLKIKDIINEVKKELDFSNIEYSDDVEIGIMIETPAAVMISNELAKEVDFFSIGTNDLTQYTLAVDRQNNKINSMYDPNHKAILRMIKIAADNAHKNGIWIGICGELAADDSLTETFLSIGIDELSMSAPFILNIKKKVLNADVSKIKEKVLSQL